MLRGSVHTGKVVSFSSAQERGGEGVVTGQRTQGEHSDNRDRVRNDALGRPVD